MAGDTRWREPIAEIPGPNVVKAKLDEGWKPIAIEWERSASGVEQAPSDGSSGPEPRLQLSFELSSEFQSESLSESESEQRRGRRSVPYGLRISSDCYHLEIDPDEKRVVEIIVAMIAGDHPLSKIADELNSREYRTRDGKPWSQVSVFRLLPRVVELGPEIMSGEEWTASKRSVLDAVG
jgi:hypothetical protein